VILGATLAIAACALVRRSPRVFGTFTLQCNPFGGLAEHNQAIDDRCGLDGVGSANSVAQNRVKNNFCAPAPATVVNVATLRALQDDVAALGIPFGQPQTIPSPADRPKLQHPDTMHGIAIGEGSLVEFVGFIIEGHYSDTSSGEDVNCKFSGDPPNDIHVAIGQALTEPECESITAEIIPHFRPHAWTILGTLHDASGPRLRQQARLDRPLRFKGQLMFDASHKPCSGEAHPAPPLRSSSWEIHPVYGIDVCTAGETLAECPVDGLVWKALDEFMKQ